MRGKWTEEHEADLHRWLQEYQADILDRDYAELPNRLHRAVKDINGFLGFVMLKLDLETSYVSGSPSHSTV